MSPQQRILHITFMACMSFALLFPQQYAYSQGVMTPLLRVALTGFAPTAGGYVRVASAYSGTGGRVYSAAMNGGARSIVAADSRALTVAGGTAAVATSAAVSIADAAIAIATCLGSALACVAVAAATAAYAAYRARRNADGSGAEQDPGVAPTVGPDQEFIASLPCAAGTSGGPHRYGTQARIAAVGDYASCLTGQPHTPGYTFVAGYACYGPGSPAIAVMSPSGDITQCMEARLTSGIDPGTATCPNPAVRPDTDGKCATGSYLPVSSAALADAVAAHPPPWGSGEGGQFDGGGASGTWKDALKEAVEQGVSAPASITNSGPAAVTGTPTVTTESTTPAPTTANPNPTPQVTSTVTTPSSTLQYPTGPFIPVLDTTTRTVTRPDGTVSTSTTAAPGATPAPAPDQAPTDTALGPLPALYTRKYPDGITGVWRDKSGAIRQTPLFSAAAGMFPNVGSSGTCPSWMLTVPGIGFDYGTFNVAPPCWIWDMAKWVVLISALLLCRALIFGG